MAGMIECAHANPAFKQRLLASLPKALQSARRSGFALDGNLACCCLVNEGFCQLMVCLIHLCYCVHVISILSGQGFR